jgi:hypothetical protein
VHVPGSVSKPSERKDQAALKERKKEATAMMISVHHAKGRIVVALALLLMFSVPSVRAAAFNLDTGNAPLFVVVPKLIPAIRGVSPGANDASIVLRIVTLTQNAWFDAIAPYHPTAVGVYSRLGRRPAGEGATNRNKNIATLYASYRVLNSLLPQNADDWRKMLKSVGLDPDNVSRDLTTAIGIGNVAGWAIVAAREHDGMNQLGDEGGRKYNRRPYADYTGYKPVNTAYELIDPGRWQPNIGTRGGGLFQVQQFVTPQWRLTKAYTFDDVSVFQVPAPTKSDPHNAAEYKQQADEVLAVSAGLTDRQKIMAELFDDKIFSIGAAGAFIDISRGLTLDEWVQMDFLTHVATFDGGIACWNEKYRHDAVRPFSAIRYLYGNQPVTAWGGVGKGTVSDLPASEWRSYMGTADHPEYPSGSACFCAAYAQAQRRFLGSDALGYFLPIPKGASRVEPGITPAKAIVLGPWATWTEFEHDCGMARVWGGVHFMSAVEAGWELCRPMGDRAYEFVKQHIDGTAPPPTP